MISQVVLSVCETTLEDGGQSEWTPLPVSIPVHARVDDRQDGQQEVTVQVVARKFVERQGRKELFASRVLATYTVHATETVTRFNIVFNKI